MKTMLQFSFTTSKLCIAGLITCYLLASGNVNGNPGFSANSSYTELSGIHPSPCQYAAAGAGSKNWAYSGDNPVLASCASSGEMTRHKRIPGKKERIQFLPFSLQNTPSISNSVDGLLNGYFFGQSAPVSSYRITAANLADNLTLNASTTFSDPTACGIVISFSPDSGFSATLMLSPVEGIVDTTIYVKPDCTAVPFISDGNIIHTSTGATNDTIAVHLENGNEYQYAPVVTIVPKKAMPSADVYVPLLADNFNGVNEAGYYIDYDPAVLSFTGIEHINPGLPDFLCNNCPHSWICCENPSGYILWFVTYLDSTNARLFIEISNDSDQLVVPDGEKLFDIVFSYSEGYSDLTFTDGYYFSAIGPYAGTELIDQPLQNYYHNGSVGPYLPKTILLDLNIEGLYNPETGIMNQAYGRDFPVSVADEITVCLASNTFPYTFEFVIDSVLLHRTGQCRFEIPGNFNSDYYLVIRHRNSIETWTRYPVSFSQDTIIYNFSDNIHKAFNDNLLLVYDKYCILNGDINQDGFIDSGDMTILDNESNQFLTGYNQSDLNGDFSTDTGDFNIVDNNTYWFVTVHHPNAPYPEVVTAEIFGITSDSAWSGGEVITQGASTVTSKGICWNTLPNPTIDHSFTTDGADFGSYISQITGLLPDTTYYVRAYSANNDTLVYGNQLNFRTLAELPVLTTTEVSGILAESAISGGILTYDGGAQIIQRGVCWSTNPAPTLTDNSTNEGGGGEVFTSQLTGLIPYTTYYLRAYASNSAGTAYGNELIFNTPEPAELTDGNNYAHYLFDEAVNVKDANNLLSQLRDITQGNTSGNDIFGGSGNFNSASGWSMASGWSISNGKLVCSGGGSGNIYRSAPVSLANAVYDLQYTIDTLSGSWVRNINCYPLVNRTSAGTITQKVISANGYLGLSKNAVTAGKIDDFTAKRIAGNHLVQYTPTNQPVVRSTYIQFDGIDNYLRTAVGADSIGTIYIVGHRIGNDTGLVVLNSLTGVGQYVNKRLTIGANDALSVFYNFRIKEMLIRKTSDDSVNRAKLNAYFQKKILVDGYNVPTGKTTSPATNANARQFIVTLIDDDATEGAYPQDPTTPDHPHQGGYYTRLHPIIVAANRYLLAHNLIQPGEEIAPGECVYIHNRLSTNPANTNYYERGYHLKCLQDLYGWEIANHSYTHFGYFEGQTIEDIEEDAEYEINIAHDELENIYGFNVNTFVYPKGIQSHILREKVAEKHTSAYTDRGAFALVNNHNNPPLNHFAVSRKTLDYILCDATGNLTNPTIALNAYKSYVDSASNAKGWLVTMCHIGAYFWKNYNALYPDTTYPAEWIVPLAKLPSDWVNSPNHVLPDGWYPYPNSLPDCLYKMIIYIYEQGGRIVLPRDGINLFGNLNTTGDVTWGVQGYEAENDSLNYEHKAVGVDGSISSYRE
ncbi:MAG: hypothetical protein V1775_08415 [Bacteroidota bacterium]